MTGRGLGFCGGAGASVGAPPAGPWLGVGLGCGWRHRHWYHATGLTGWQRGRIGWPGPGTSFEPGVSEELELAAVRQQTRVLERALDELRARIRELEKPVADDTPPAGKEAR